MKRTNRSKMGNETPSPSESPVPSGTPELPLNSVAESPCAGQRMRLRNPSERRRSKLFEDYEYEWPQFSKVPRKERINKLTGTKTDNTKSPKGPTYKENESNANDSTIEIILTESHSVEKINLQGSDEATHGNIESNTVQLNELLESATCVLDVESVQESLKPNSTKVTVPVKASNKDVQENTCMRKYDSIELYTAVEPQELITSNLATEKPKFESETIKNDPEHIEKQEKVVCKEVVDQHETSLGGFSLNDDAHEEKTDTKSNKSSSPVSFVHSFSLYDEVKSTNETAYLNSLYNDDFEEDVGANSVTDSQWSENLQEYFEEPERISTGKEEKTTIDGVDFLSFENEADLKEFTVKDEDYINSYKNVDVNNDFIETEDTISYKEYNPRKSITPIQKLGFNPNKIERKLNKTNDITKIKGWQRKFAHTLLPSSSTSHTDLNQSYVEFAVSTLVVPESDTIVESKCHKKTKSTPNKNDNKTRNVVKDVMDKILDGVEDLIDIDDDEVNDYVHDEECTRKTNNELRRLGHLVIDIDDRVKPSLTKTTRISTGKCNNDFCKLGCVCDSLNAGAHTINHCGKVNCMFKCTCVSVPRVAVERLIEDEQRDLAPAEKAFRHAIIRDDKGVVLAKERGKRTSRLPRHLVQDMLIGEALAEQKRKRNKKNTKEIDKDTEKKEPMKKRQSLLQECKKFDDNDYVSVPSPEFLHLPEQSSSRQRKDFELKSQLYNSEGGFINTDIEKKLLASIKEEDEIDDYMEVDGQSWQMNNTEQECYMEKAEFGNIINVTTLTTEEFDVVDMPPEILPYITDSSKKVSQNNVTTIKRNAAKERAIKIIKLLPLIPINAYKFRADVISDDAITFLTWSSLKARFEDKSLNIWFKLPITDVHFIVTEVTDEIFPDGYINLNGYKRSSNKHLEVLPNIAKQLLSTTNPAQIQNFCCVFWCNGKYWEFIDTLRHTIRHEFPTSNGLDVPKVMQRQDLPSDTMKTKWYCLDNKNDFASILITSLNLSFSRSKIAQVISYSANHKKTAYLDISNSQPSADGVKFKAPFGLYALPNKKSVYIGPYSTREHPLFELVPVEGNICKSSISPEYVEAETTILYKSSKNDHESSPEKDDEAKDSFKMSPSSLDYVSSRGRVRKIPKYLFDNDFDESVLAVKKRSNENTGGPLSKKKNIKKVKNAIVTPREIPSTADGRMEVLENSEIIHETVTSNKTINAKSFGVAKREEDLDDVPLVFRVPKAPRKLKVKKGILKMLTCSNSGIYPVPIVIYKNDSVRVRNPFGRRVGFFENLEHAKRFLSHVFCHAFDVRVDEWKATDADATFFDAKFIKEGIEKAKARIIPEKHLNSAIAPIERTSADRPIRYRWKPAKHKENEYVIKVLEECDENEVIGNIKNAKRVYGKMSRRFLFKSFINQKAFEAKVCGKEKKSKKPKDKKDESIAMPDQMPVNVRIVSGDFVSENGELYCYGVIAEENEETEEIQTFDINDTEFEKGIQYNETVDIEGNLVVDNKKAETNQYKNGIKIDDDNQGVEDIAFPELSESDSDDSVYDDNTSEETGAYVRRYKKMHRSIFTNRKLATHGERFALTSAYLDLFLGLRKDRRYKKLHPTQASLLDLGTYEIRRLKNVNSDYVKTYADLLLEKDRLSAQYKSLLSEYDDDEQRKIHSKVSSLMNRRKLIIPDLELAKRAYIPDHDYGLPPTDINELKKAFFKIEIAAPPISNIKDESPSTSEQSKNEDLESCGRDVIIFTSGTLQQDVGLAGVLACSEDATMKIPGKQSLLKCKYKTESAVENFSSNENPSLNTTELPGKSDTSAPKLIKFTVSEKKSSPSDVNLVEICKSSDASSSTQNLDRPQLIINKALMKAKIEAAKTGKLATSSVIKINDDSTESSERNVVIIDDTDYSSDTSNLDLSLTSTTHLSLVRPAAESSLFPNNFVPRTSPEPSISVLKILDGSIERNIAAGKPLLSDIDPVLCIDITDDPDEILNNKHEDLLDNCVISPEGQIRNKNKYKRTSKEVFLDQALEIETIKTILSVESDVSDNLTATNADIKCKISNFSPSPQIDVAEKLHPTGSLSKTSNNSVLCSSNSRTDTTPLAPCTYTKDFGEDPIIVNLPSANMKLPIPRLQPAPNINSILVKTKHNGISKSPVTKTVNSQIPGLKFNKRKATSTNPSFPQSPSAKIQKIIIPPTMAKTSTVNSKNRQLTSQESVLKTQLYRNILPSPVSSTVTGNSSNDNSSSTVKALIEKSKQKDLAKEVSNGSVKLTDELTLTLASTNSNFEITKPISAPDVSITRTN